MSGNEDERAAAYMQRMVDKITKYGHMVQSVFPAEGDDGVPFSYTVGRTIQRAPELLITGPLPMQVQAALLNDAAAIEDLAAGQERDDLIQGGVMRVVSVDARASEMFQAIYLFEPTPIRALQLVWPDTQGRFPNDEGYDQERFPQPVRFG